MSVKATPYVSFRDAAREAMEFYQSVVGGEVTFSTFGEFQMSEDPADQDKIMHSQLVKDGEVVVMASDAPSTMPYDAREGAFSIALFGDAGDADDLRRWFAGLAEGGSVVEPLVQAPWGDEFGMLKDKFGIDWMINIAAEGQSV